MCQCGYTEYRVAMCHVPCAMCHVPYHAMSTQMAWHGMAEIFCKKWKIWGQERLRPGDLQHEVGAHYVSDLAPERLLLLKISENRGSAMFDVPYAMPAKIWIHNKKKHFFPIFDFFAKYLCHAMPWPFEYTNNLQWNWVIAMVSAWFCSPAGPKCTSSSRYSILEIFIR